jgi:hypothetical protein
MDNWAVGSRVGFISKAMIPLIQDGVFAQVLTLYEESKNRKDRERSYRNGGMALVSILNGRHLH